MSVTARLAVYALGVASVSLGIVLCRKCGWGISPISCIPLVLASATSLSFGTWTTLFHFANTAAQMALGRRAGDVRLWLQVPLALAFGVLIDFLGSVVAVNQANVACRVAALTGSVLLTALGMVLMVDMDLVQNPPDGTVKCLAELAGMELGTMKVAYDVACVAAALALGLALLGRVEGIGVATLVSAVLVGRTVGWARALGARLDANR